MKLEIITLDITMFIYFLLENKQKMSKIQKTLKLYEREETVGKSFWKCINKFGVSKKVCIYCKKSEFEDDH